MYRTRGPFLGYGSWDVRYTPDEWGWIFQGCVSTTGIHLHCYLSAGGMRRVCLRRGSRRSDASASQSDTRTTALLLAANNTRILAATLINIVKPPLDTKTKTKPGANAIDEFRMCLVCRQQRRENARTLGKTLLDPYFFSFFYFPMGRKVSWKSFPTSVKVLSKDLTHGLKIYWLCKLNLQQEFVTFFG